jgi:transcriptional antiterminator RfaH
MFWTVARLLQRHEALAMHALAVAGYETYLPRLREMRVSRGRKIEVRPPLFPGYCFVAIELQWHAARWSAGVIGLIMGGGGQPARVPDSVIAEIRRRERNGLVELPRPRGLRIGDEVRITRGVLEGRLALYQGMRPQQRVEVLLAVLGRVTLPRGDVEAVEAKDRPFGG